MRTAHARSSLPCARRMVAWAASGDPKAMLIPCAKASAFRASIMGMLAASPIAVSLSKSLGGRP